LLIENLAVQNMHGFEANRKEFGARKLSILSPAAALRNVRRAWNKLLRGPELLWASLLLLFVLSWILPFNLFRSIPPPPHLPTSLTYAGSLAYRLGWWIKYIGWDSGPPGEFAYDFLAFWHLALSFLILTLCLSRLSRDVSQAGDEAQMIPGGIPQFIQLLTRRKFIFWLKAYPILCCALLIASPWNEDNLVQKFFYIIAGISVMISFTYAPLERIHAGQESFIRLRFVLCGLPWIFAPIWGGRIFSLYIWALWIWSIYELTHVGFRKVRIANSQGRRTGSS